MLSRINVLDHGYVRFVDKMGSDLTVVNAARVSFEKESTDLSAHDERLLRYLLRNNELSPFRHASIAFEIYAPLMVARQLWKYVVGGDHTVLGWNESSRRYVTEEPVFYVPSPDTWRTAPEHRKQGSAAPLPASQGAQWTTLLTAVIQHGVHSYRAALDAGIAPEIARLYLPAYAMYIRWRWATSLQGVLHMGRERLSHNAQHETAQYAEALITLTAQHFPVSVRLAREIQQW